MITVPHTGTHFAIKFLEILDLPHNVGKGINYNHHHAIPEITPHMKLLYETCIGTKCIVTARDPILNAIRYMTNGQPLTQASNTWKVFLEILPWMNDVFVLDIGCREEDRADHLYDLARFIDKNPNEYMDSIKSYANDWKPLNTSDSPEKSRYIEYGELPKGVDWSAFDEAVEWYKSLPTNDA